MATLPFESTEFQAQLDECEQWLDCWVAQYRTSYAACFGITTGEMFARLANSLIVAGARAVVGQQTSRSTSKAARHAAYSAGAVEAPKRETRDQRVAREARAWGLAS